MKNLLQLIAGVILTSIIFSSCSQKMSIAKRRYNSGYYVSHTSKKHVKAKQGEIAKYEKMERVNPELSNEKNKEVSAPDRNQLIAEAAIEQAAIQGKEQYKKQERVLSKKERFVYNTYANHEDQIKRIEKLTGNKMLTERIGTKMKGQHTAGDVLSLFWVVLLILLLLYLIGLLFDGFGLGWAIHLILLVLLILFILWLLRVV